MPSPLQLDIGANFTGGAAFDEADSRLKKTGAGADSLAEPLAKVVALGNQMSKAFAFTAVGLAGFGVGEILNFNAEITKTAALMKEQAAAVGLTTDELQAYQAAARSGGSNVETMQKTLGTFNDALGKAAAGSPEAARAFIELGVKILDTKGNIRDTSDVLTETARALLAIESPATRAALATTLFGKEGKQITPILEEIAKGMGLLTANAQNTGQMLSSSTIDALHKVQSAADLARVQVNNLWAQFAAPIDLKFLLAEKATLEAILAVMDGLEKHTDKRQTRIAGNAVDSSRADVASAQKTLDDHQAMAARLNSTSTLPFGLGSAPRPDSAAMTRQLAADRERLATATAKLVIDEKNLADAHANEITKGISRQLGSPDSPPMIPPDGTKGAGFAQPKTTGRDHIQEEIDRYKAEAKAAQDAINVLLSAPAGIPLDKLREAADLAKKIGDAKASAEKTNPKDPRIPQLEASITQAAQAQQAEARLSAAFALADQTSAKFGDGTQELTNRQSLLKQALDAGRLSQQAYTAAMIEATQTQAEQALKAKQYATGIQGLSAGFQFAALQQQKQTTAFSMGGQIYTNTFQLMKTAVNDWATTGVFNFQKIEQGFAQMLANMALQAAQNQIGQLLFGGGGTSGVPGGGLLGTLLNGLGLGGGGGTGGGGGIPIANTNPLPFASGGRPPVGVPSIVGEAGEELFIPDQPGTIVPNGKFGNGHSVVMHNYYSFGSDVDRGTLKTWGEQVTKQSVARVMNEMNRAGPMRAAARK